MRKQEQEKKPGEGEEEGEMVSLGHMGTVWVSKEEIEKRQKEKEAEQSRQEKQEQRRPFTP